ncbi:MAG: Uma2 family endonuclease [Phormidesmis sp.]
MIAIPQPRRMTAKEYLEWESQQEIRHEYCDGEVFAMAGRTKGHNRAALNLYSELVNRVDADGCEINTSDVKVKVNEGLSYRYPNLVVSCDECDKSEVEFYQFPKLIVEVLSSSTEAVDRDEKFQEYIQIPTLEEYVLISAKRIQVECFRRGEGRMWLYFPYREGETVEIASVGVELPIEQIYRNVRLDTAEAEQAL